MRSVTGDFVFQPYTEALRRSCVMMQLRARLVPCMYDESVLSAPEATGLQTGNRKIEFKD
jgi:hypothetical protein